MGIVRLPFGLPTYRNADETALSESSALLIDGTVKIVDGLPLINKRWGLSTFCTIDDNGSPVNGFEYWPTNSVLIAVHNGKVYSIDSAGTATLRGTSAELNTNNRLSIQDTGANIYFANGGKIQQLTSAYVLTDVGGSAPTLVSFLATVNNKLLANNASSAIFHVSDVLAYGTFSGEQYYASVNPDNATAIFGYGDYVIVFGLSSSEGWNDTGDASLTFQRNPSFSLNEHGVLSPQTICYNKDDGAFYYLSNNKTIVQYVPGSIPKPIQTPYDKVIQGFTDATSSYASIYKIDGITQYALTFPTSKRTIIINLSNGFFSEWGRWVAATATYEHFLGYYYKYISAWDKHLVADRSTGRIFEMKSTVYQDNSLALRTLYRTGCINHGTENEKRSKSLMLMFKRGVAGATDVLVRVRWKDDNSDWGDWVDCSLGLTGDNYPYIYLSPMGSYRTRQYEVTHAGNTEFTLIRAEEDVEVCSR